MKAKNNGLILGLALIFIRRKFEMIVKEKNTFAWMSHLISIIQVGIVVLKQVKIPCLVKFSEGGCILENILTNILMNLDVLKLYGNDMENVILPVLLVYGHVSHFDLEFLQYICNENNKRTVVFGVPYWTPLWQVRDSAENNGT